MQHDTRKVNSFIRYAGRCDEGMPYTEILNGWIEETGEGVSGADELHYLIGLIPMALKRGNVRNRARQAQAR